MHCFRLADRFSSVEVELCCAWLWVGKSNTITPNALLFLLLSWLYMLSLMPHGMWSAFLALSHPNSVSVLLSSNYKHPCIINIVSGTCKAQPCASCCEGNWLYPSQTQHSLFFEKILYCFCIIFVEPHYTGWMLCLLGVGHWWQAVLP